MDGEPIDVATANQLLGDELARRVAWTHIVTDRGTITVSTMFLVLDHRIALSDRAGPPVLWETVVFDGPTGDEMSRYASRGQAVVGHAEAVAIVLAALDVDGVRVLTVDEYSGDQVAAKDTKRGDV